MSRMSRTLGTLLRSGVPVLQSLEITKETTGNRIVAEALEDVENSVRQGESLARPAGAAQGRPADGHADAGRR